MSSCSSSRTYEMIKFWLLWPKYFRKVSEDGMQPGDVVLVPIESNGFQQYIFKHAAVYCGEGEVIHMQKEHPFAKISKEGYKAMKSRRGKCQIYRKRGGINLPEFQRKVQEAMDWEVKYDLRENNCIHFALHLVGLADFYKEMVTIPYQGVGSSALVRAHEMTKGFRKVSEDDLQPEDMLFLFEKSAVLQNIFKHAAIYCGEGEVIHMQEEHPFAKISKEGYEAMKGRRGKCQVYWKEDGINLSEFQCKVQEAMDWEVMYNFICFIIHLVALADCYGEMVN